MTEQLKTMLHDAADDHPDLTLRGDPWRRGRRIRLRRRFAGVAGATVTAAAVTAGAVLLTTPDLTSTPEPAQEQPAEPALPDTLYEVPPNIADISDEPLGEPAAVVYHAVLRSSLFNEASKPLVVGAESGEVRAVRQAGPTDQAVLSPDGTKLAIGDGGRSDADPEDGPPTVLVVDLVDGKSARYTLPDDGLGGTIEGPVWAPDSSRIALTVEAITRILEDGYESRATPGWLELPSGEWDEHEFGRIEALSDDGARMVVDGSFSPGSPIGYAVQGVDGESLTKLDVESAPWGIALAPDDERLATITFHGGTYSGSDPYRLEIYDASTGQLTDQVELGEYAGARVVSWGERGILVHTTTAGDNTSGVVERIDLTGADDPEREIVLVDQSSSDRIGVAAALEDADTREATPPEAGFDWIRWVPEPVVLVILGVLIAPFILLAVLTRRRRVVVVPGAVEPDKPGGRSDQ